VMSCQGLVRQGLLGGIALGTRSSHVDMRAPSFTPGEEVRGSGGLTWGARAGPLNACNTPDSLTTVMRASL
jgi:hypothetical protein